MITEAEILNDIQQIYRKIDQCYRSKEDLSAQITRERADIIGLELLSRQIESGLPLENGHGSTKNQ